MSLNDLQQLSLESLATRGAELGMRLRAETSRHHMVLDQARFHLAPRRGSFRHRLSRA